MSEEFSPFPALMGGLVIAVSSSLYLLFAGRITGMSGFLDGVVSVDAATFHWKAVYVVCRCLCIAVVCALQMNVHICAIVCTWQLINVRIYLCAYKCRCDRESRVRVRTKGSRELRASTLLGRDPCTHGVRM